MTQQHLTGTSPHYRIKPAPLVGIVMVLLYIVITFGIQLSTGIPYAEWTSTPENGLRAAVIPLVVGSLLLIIFLAIARWDMIWRDPARLPTTTVMKVAMIFFIACIVLRAFGIDWGTVDPALLFVVIATGVRVGFAEEMLFRGIFLRSLRTNGRTEAVAALWTAIAFGLFHLPNLIVGVGGGQIIQVLLAAASGATLYAFRRYRGLILTGMIAHGIWDMSTFLAASNGRDWANLAGLLTAVVSFILGIAVLVSVWRKDRNTVVTPAGIEQKQD